jgi:3',5'-cyclic AMP phosphodiesterase CpdA
MAKIMNPFGNHGSRTNRPLRRLLAGFGIILVSTVVILAGVLKSHGYSINDFLPWKAPLHVSPYVQNVTQTSIAILWDTPKQSPSVVHYGRSSALGRTASDSAGKRHDVHLSGLKPDTDYYYQASDTGLAGDIHTFHTAPSAQADITFAVIGDSGTGSNGQYLMSAVLAGVSPQLVLHVGDVVYKTGSERQYAPHFYRPYHELLSSVPFYPSLGNHDVRTQDGAPYLHAFDLPKNNPQNTERYYSFNYGPVHFVALDSELYYGDHSFSTRQQKAWLEKDLDQNRHPWTVVFFHRPQISSALGPHPGGSSRIRQDLVPIFEHAHVNLVLSGHQHNYERFRAIHGVTYIISGGGGGERYPLASGPHSAYAAARLNVLKVTASPQVMQVEALGADGAVFDHVRLTPKTAAAAGTDSIGASATARTKVRR